MVPTIAILGDYDPTLANHRALDEAAGHAAAVLASPVEFQWVATDELLIDDLGTRFQGLWVAPGSPYRDETRVLEALTRARTTDLPTLGNCGGFQFMVLEYAQRVLGVADARHEESGDGPGPAVIHALACSLRGVTETLTVAPWSRLARVVGAGTLEGRYFCRYGVDPSFAPRLEAAGLWWTSHSPEGEPRSFELPGHRFYLGCLFQPALASAEGRPHPVIVAFLDEVAAGPLVYREFSDLPDDFVALTRALDRELRAKNGDAQDVYDGFNKLAGIADVVVAYQRERPVGCASFKVREPGLAEVKRVYVDPAVRGRGVSKALMTALEVRARRGGIRTLLVETSRTFVEANRLYPGLGYQECENFPPYEGMALSICYRKELA